MAYDFFLAREPGWLSRDRPGGGGGRNSICGENKGIDRSMPLFHKAERDSLRICVYPTKVSDSTS